MKKSCNKQIVLTHMLVLLHKAYLALFFIAYLYMQPLLFPNFTFFLFFHFYFISSVKLLCVVSVDNRCFPFASCSEGKTSTIKPVPALQNWSCPSWLPA